MSIFKDKVLLITRGTGSLDNAMSRRYSNSRKNIDWDNVPIVKL
jgi:hypothetical protein